MASLPFMGGSPAFARHRSGEETSEVPGSLDSPSSLSSSHQQRSPRPRREERCIAIGIDFGTTYSGVSWAHSATPNDIHHVAHWPFDGRRGKDEVQVPTQIDIDTKRWGYLVTKDDSPVRWFKLLLLERRDLKRDMKDFSIPLEQSRERLQRNSGFEPSAVIELVAEFLQKLWDHTLEEIKYEIDIDLLPIKVAITVPAIWPLYARKNMEAAAAKAGITKPRRIGETELILVEEPEAAAVSTLFDRKDYPEIEVGESFIVCDCGGGTVDITSYTVTSVSPFIVKEAAKGDGKLCGAFLIDDAFENWMNFKSGLKFEKCEPEEVRVFVEEEWEHGIKQAFTGKEMSFSIRPPARAFGILKRSRGAIDSFQVSSDVVKQFYARTYNGIRELISEQKTQIAKTTGKQPKKILLVGGLGSSRYLYLMLQEQYRNVLQPSHAWSAVSRGAVIAILKNAYNPAGASLVGGSNHTTEDQTLPSMPHVIGSKAPAKWTLPSVTHVDGSNTAMNRTLTSIPHIEGNNTATNRTLPSVTHVDGSNTAANPTLPSMPHVFSGIARASPVENILPPLDPVKGKPFVDKEGVKKVRRGEWYLKKVGSVQDKDSSTHSFTTEFPGPDDTNVVLIFHPSEADSQPIVWRDPSVRQLQGLELVFSSLI